MYKFKDSRGAEGLEARYWNCGGTNICIVAQITEGIDWAAYIGADKSDTEEEALEYSISYGCKLLEKDARYFLPGISLPYRS